MACVKKEKVFFVRHDTSRRVLSLEFVNVDVFERNSLLGFRAIDPRERGFAHVPSDERPLLRVDERQGRALLDFEEFYGYWIVSKKSKGVLERLDSKAFQFLPCDVTYTYTEAKQSYWICDVINVVEALDENASNIQIRFGTSKQYRVINPTQLAFQDELISESMIFRMKFAESYIFAKKAFRDLYRAERLKGIAFSELRTDPNMLGGFDGC